MFDAHSHLSDASSFVSRPPGDKSPVCLKESIQLLPGDFTVEAFALLKEEILGNPSLLIGEVGLDRRVRDTVSADLQEHNLRLILDFAEKERRAVVLHCVGYDGRMLRVIRDYPSLRFLWHGFNGSKETLSLLLGLGVSVSLRPGFKEEIALCPYDFLIESDYTGTSQREHGRILEENYARYAALKGLSAAEAHKRSRNAGQIFEN